MCLCVWAERCSCTWHAGDKTCHQTGILHGLNHLQDKHHHNKNTDPPKSVLACSDNEVVQCDIHVLNIENIETFEQARTPPDPQNIQILFWLKQHACTFETCCTSASLEREGCDQQINRFCHPPATTNTQGKGTSANQSRTDPGPRGSDNTHHRKTAALITTASV